MRFILGLNIFKAVFFTIFLQTTAYSWGAEITSISEDKIKSVEGKVEFHCAIKNPNNNTLLWVKISNDRHEQFFLATNTAMLINNKRFSVNYNTNTSIYSLKIKNLQKDDSGFYQCQISKDVNDKISKEVRLDIESPPEIIRISSPTSILEGKSTDLECKADGNPVPQVTWRREYDEILPIGGTSFNENVLNISSVDRRHRGTYYCIADNGISPVAKSEVKLNVEFAPVVDTPRPRIGQARGYNVKLHCHIEANPAPTVTWLKNGREIVKEVPHSSTDEFIHTHYVTLIQSSDYGYYTCRVQNAHGVADTIIELYRTDIPWNFSE